MSGIRLSKKHGVNPSMYQCFICGENIGLVLFGSGYGKDEEAPRSVGAIDMEPCDTCKGHMQQGVILISVRDGESGPNPYRTGGWCVVKDDAIRRIFHGEVVDSVLSKRVCFVPDQAWDQIGLPRHA